MVSFGWFVRDGFHLYSFFGTCFLRSSFSTLHSVILILGFTAGFLFRFLVLVLFVFISVYLGGGVLPIEYEIISLSNSSPFFLPITSSPSLLELIRCGLKGMRDSEVFFSFVFL